MPKNLYEPASLLARAKEWRIEAAAATTPEMRAFCLDEAVRCETVVRQSLETPPLSEGGPTQRERTNRTTRRISQMSPARRSMAATSGTTERR